MMFITSSATRLKLRLRKTSVYSRPNASYSQPKKLWVFTSGVVPAVSAAASPSSPSAAAAGAVIRLSTAEKTPSIAINKVAESTHAPNHPKPSCCRIKRPPKNSFSALQGFTAND